MDSAIPVSIVGGYLGSGKTTLINHLLRNANGERLAILVNDFGELPIDADLIEAEQDDIISLAGGCVCCSYGNDLTQALLSLADSESGYDHVFIETSGVALPNSIAQSLTLLPAFQLLGIVVLVDAATLIIQINDRYVGDTIQNQLGSADIILINKIDLVSEDALAKLESTVKQFAEKAALVFVNNAAVSSDVLLKAYSNEVQLQKLPALNNSHAEALFDSIAVRQLSALDANVVAARLAHDVAGLVRAKGFVRSSNGHMHTIQVVGNRWSVSSAPKGVQCGLVCIGHKHGQFKQELELVWTSLSS